MAINLPAKLEELLVLFLREDGVRQALDRELILLRQGSWTLESAVAPPTTSSALRSPPVARAATYATPPRRKRSAAGAARLDAVAAAASAGEEEDDVNDPNDLTPDYPPPSTTPPRALAVPCFYQRPENRSTSKLDRLLLEQVREAFDEGDLLLRVEDFELIAKVCGLSTYLAADLFRACGGQGDSGVPISRFTAYWEDLAAQCVTLPEKVMRLLNADGGPLTPAHLRCLVGFVLKTHPGLDFLLESPQYHERYIDTVIARMFYSINRSWSGKITLRELRRSDFLEVLQFLDDEPNINKELRYFSYEHFYVIYTCFWKLDKDRDLLIDQEELSRHGDCGLSNLVLDRIFAQTVFTQPTSGNQMSYWDFVYFILSEEDKTTPTAIEYWFRLLDLDGDGVLSLYELELLYAQQLSRMEELNMESLPFRDCLCQALDIVRPRRSSVVQLADLKRCKQASAIINTFVNLNKYLDLEEQAQGSSMDDDDIKLTDWQRFAMREYILLSAEEGDSDDDLDALDDCTDSPLRPY